MVALVLCFVGILMGMNTASAEAFDTSSEANTPHFQADEATRREARRRAQEATRQSRSTVDFSAEDTRRDVDYRSMEQRKNAVPRDLPTIQRPGCPGLKNAPPVQLPSNCQGCSSCQKPPASPEDAGRSGLPQILLATLFLAVILGLAYRFFIGRKNLVSGPASEHDLIQEARGLTATAVEDALARGDNNAAIHALFLQSLLRLSDAGYTIRPDWTPRELPRGLALKNELQSPLLRLIQLAEFARFADHRSSKEEVADAQQNALHIRQHLAIQDPRASDD